MPSPPLAEPIALLEFLFGQAVQAAQPSRVLPQQLPTERQQPAIVIGAGKAAAAMATTLETHWHGPLSGLIVTPYGHAQSCAALEVIEAAHPTPDANSEIAARRILQLVSNLERNALVICLLSGGGSSLLALPLAGLTLEDKQVVNRQLLRSGANIAEINCVRKHLSAIKGGRLAAACAPARLITYAISDVPGDVPATIASGPTVADDSNPQAAIDILQRYPIKLESDVSARLYAHLETPQAQTLPSDDPILSNTQFHIIASATQSLNAAKKAAQAAGLPVHLLGADIQGEAREVAREHAAFALKLSREGATPCLILSGGETTVTVRGEGRGGRNTEYLLSLAIALHGADDIYALAADTDGIDGIEDNAGAVLTPQCWQDATTAGLNPQELLDDNNSHRFFSALDTLFITGPTHTNVNDFRAILVLS